MCVVVVVFVRACVRVFVFWGGVVCVRVMMCVCSLFVVLFVVCAPVWFVPARFVFWCCSCVCLCLVFGVAFLQFLLSCDWYVFVSCFGFACRCVFNRLYVFVFVLGLRLCDRLLLFVCVLLLVCFFACVYCALVVVFWL